METQPVPQHWLTRLHQIQIQINMIAQMAINQVEMEEVAKKKIQQTLAAQPESLPGLSFTLA